jgi:penicillin-binding protein 1A
MSWSAPHPRRLVAGLLVVALTAVGCSYTSRDALPSAAASMQSSTLYAADGTPIRTFHAEENRQDVSLERIPIQLRDAVIAIEDERFYRHHGVDLRAVMRAVRANADSNGDVTQGGSTITQQYVKQVLLADTSKTASRKLREATLAVQLERHYSKDRILELYLNAVYFGNGAYGVEAAAEQYFAKDVGQLTLAEDALLAGLIQRPTANDPYDNPTAATARRNIVLDKMARNHFATRADVEAAKDAPLQLADPTIPSEERYPAAYFAQAVQDWILHDPRFGATAQQRQDLLFGGGLRIQTTVDLKAQAAAEAAANAILPNAQKDPDVALVSMDPSTGAIKAMVGGRDFFGPGSAAKVNLAMRGRPTGSSFKPFVLAAALTQGLSPAKTYQAPQCISIPGARNADGSPWRPCNAADGESFGPTNLVDATVHSINTVYAQLIMDVGPKAAVDEAAKLGVQSPLKAFPSAVLGTNDVTPVDMAAAYSTFANRGQAVGPYLVSRITRADGTILYAHQQSEKRVLDAGIADTVTAILQGVIQHGTGTAANIGRPAAGKTGTGQEEADAWFVGYTPQLTTAVWVGYHRGEVPMQPPTTPITVFGGTYPARIWQRYMTAALTGVPVQQFTAPPADAFLPNPNDTVPPEADAAAQQDLYEQIQQYYDDGVGPNGYVDGGTDGDLPNSATDGGTGGGTDGTPRSTTTTEHAAQIARVPDVTGETASRATADLRAAGFRVSRHAAAGPYTAGTVVSQSPPGGSLATVGSTVSIGVVGG